MLTWSSIGYELEYAVSQYGRRLRLVICPFIQLQALKRLFDPVENVEGIQIITRWNASDLISGVSDIEVFPYLRDRDIPLFVHRRIHLKLYIFDDGTAFLGSGNLTQSGLGWGERANVEAGSFVPLTGGDWAHINKILRESARVDESIYKLTSEFKEKHGMRIPSGPEFDLPFPGSGGFSLLDLPIATSPGALIEAYKSMRKGEPTEPGLMHDLVLLGLNATTPESDPMPAILSNFRQLPPVQAILGWLSASGSRSSLGEVTQWLHSRLIDRPVPFRTDVKTAVANLYRWLPLAFDTISVGRPNYSEVLYFKKPG